MSNLFGSKEVSVLGVDIGSSAIKVVQLKKKGARAILETYGELALGPYANLGIGRATNLSSESLGIALTDLLKESGANARSAGLSIPLSASLMTLIELPELGEKEINSIIPIEARKYVPVPISEVSLDWWMIPKEEKSVFSMGEKVKQQGPGKVEVLIVAIHNSAVQKYREVVTKASLENTSFFELETFSTIRAVASQEIAPVMIVDMGAASTKLYIVELGVVRTSHVISRGSQEITIALSKSLDLSVEKAEQMKRTIGVSTLPEHKATTDTVMLALDYIVAEARRVLLTYEKRYNTTISKVILTGGGALLPGFFDVMSKNFEAEVVYANPFAKVETPAFLGNVLEKAGPEFAVSIGLALRKIQEFA